MEGASSMSASVASVVPPARRKRKRLSQVLDQLNAAVQGASEDAQQQEVGELMAESGARTPPTPSEEEDDDEDDDDDDGEESSPDGRRSCAKGVPRVFRFDSADRERLLSAVGANAQDDEDVFSPSTSSRSAQSAASSPQVSGDSPRMSSLSPHRGKDSGMEEDFPMAVGGPPPTLGAASLHWGGGASLTASIALHGGVPADPSSPTTPSTPLSSASASPLLPPHHSTLAVAHAAEQYFRCSQLMPELFRRRCHSDSELPPLCWPPPPTPTANTLGLSIPIGVATHAAGAIRSGVRATRVPRGTRGWNRGTRAPRSRLSSSSSASSSRHQMAAPSRGGSLESEPPSPQESPLDLSVRGGLTGLTGLTGLGGIAGGLGGLAGIGAVGSFSLGSSTSSESLLMATSPLLPPVAITLAPPPSSKRRHAASSGGRVSSSSYQCPACGQTFSQQDRLAKHMSTRHKKLVGTTGSPQPAVPPGSPPDDDSSPNKSYSCDVCRRSFARSDMLTRHMRLHTGAKPYTCASCGQVFSRSDHLSTHQRTHTGEKPYRCPRCPYAACRRDMITRHLRTHARLDVGPNGAGSIYDQHMEGDNPPSPSQALRALSVHSPATLSPSPTDT